MSKTHRNVTISFLILFGLYLYIRLSQTESSLLVGLLIGGILWTIVYWWVAPDKKNGAFAWLSAISTWLFWIIGFPIILYMVLDFIMVDEDMIFLWFWVIVIILIIYANNKGKDEKPKFKQYKSKENQYPGNWEKIRKLVLKRDGNKCGNCGTETELHVHHIVPISKGGTNNLSNLRTLCKTCHKKLHPHMK